MATDGALSLAADGIIALMLLLVCLGIARVDLGSFFVFPAAPFPEHVSERAYEVFGLCYLFPNE